MNLTAAGEVNVAGSLELSKQRATNLPPPANFEEVGERLNQIAAALNQQEQSISEQAMGLRDEFGEMLKKTTSEFAERHDHLGTLVEEETRNRFRERRREGTLFAGGLVLQVLGASVLLFVC